MRRNDEKLQGKFLKNSSFHKIRLNKLFTALFHTEKDELIFQILLRQKSYLILINLIVYELWALVEPSFLPEKSEQNFIINELI